MQPVQAVGVGVRARAGALQPLRPADAGGDGDGAVRRAAGLGRGASVRLECPACGGEGGLLSQSGPGTFSSAHGNYLPDEAWLECRACGGEGVVEACPTCRQPLRWVAGQERCGCSWLKRAA